MLFKYLGRQYDTDAAWRLIEDGFAELVELTPTQVQAIQRLPVPKPTRDRPPEDLNDPIVLVRDAIPEGEEPPEIVMVLIDGWGRFIKKTTWDGAPRIQAWIFEDTDLVEEQIVVSAEKERHGT